MSGLSSIPGTNLPPVSFPGIASGIDYNSIIQKLTSLTLSQATPLNQQIATLNASNAELIKINGLLSKVQDSLNGLSLSDVYNAVSATSSNTGVLTAQGISGSSASPGTYTINSVTLATATNVTGSVLAGHSELDALGASTGDQVALADSYAAITPSNGSGTQGSVTINGVTVTYNVNSDSLQTIFANINTAVQTATGDATFHIGFAPGTDTVQITDANNPISLGSANDQGNLLQVLRLDQAQVVNGGGGSVTATAGVGGINQAKMFNSTNSAGTATNANYVTPVTSGSFTINGVAISVNAATDNLASVLKRINASSAGVLATYDSATGRITLANKATGTTGIVLGGSGDTSNFLSATGLTAGSGATTTLGTQASVTFQDSGGTTHTVYSNSNTVTTAIPGVQLNLLSAAASPFQVTVGQDNTKLVSAVNTFVSAYNAAISEINAATAAPIVPQSAVGASVGVPQTAAVGGGVLFGNADVEMIKDQLVNMVSSYLPNASGYTSLAQLGLTLTSSFTQLAAASPDSASSSTVGSTGQQTSSVTTETVKGTDGQLVVDTSKLAQAFAANASAVQNLLAGAQGVVTQMGTYLTGVTGLPTQTESGFVGSIPTTSLLQGFENSNDSLITSIQQQIQVIKDNANQQADALRNEFVGTETALAGYQALQQQLSGFFKSSSGG